MSEADYFMKLCELQKGSSQNTSFWRTSQRCLLGDWERFSENWPRSGLMLNGTVYRLPPLVRLTSAIGFSSSVIPTVTASCHKGSPRNRYPGSPHYRGNLAEYVNTPEGSNGQLNPEWLEHLMGFESGWTELDA